MRKTDLIRVDQRFADALRKVAEESGESMIDITAQININEKREKRVRRPNDPFDLTVVD